MHANYYNRRRSTGLSLIEVMIALVIGVVLLTGIMQIFGSTQLAFSTAEGASRVQENARFAFDMLRNDVRMSAHVGCRSERHYSSANEALFNHAANPPRTSQPHPSPCGSIWRWKPSSSQAVAQARWLT